MKTNVNWWGVQFFSETEEDKDILRLLYSKLNEEDIDFYEGGYVKLIEKEHEEDLYLSDKYTKIKTDLSLMLHR